MITSLRWDKTQGAKKEEQDALRRHTYDGQISLGGSVDGEVKLQCAWAGQPVRAHQLLSSN
jgi:hypothetical protein